MDMENVVLHYRNGKILKGQLKDFSQKAEAISFKMSGSNKSSSIKMSDLKAIFFVKTFEGNAKHRERKLYSTRNTHMKKIYVKFKDGESLAGYLEGSIPWDKGFFLSGKEPERKGFFLIPADEGSNNLKIFVVHSSIEDIAVLP